MTSNTIIGEGYKPDIAPAQETSFEEVSRDWSDIKKAEREDFINGHKTKILDTDTTVFSRPRQGCRYCYGTGVEGVWDEKSLKSPGELKLCRCVTNKLLSLSNVTDTNCLTYGEFREMISRGKKRYNIKETTYEDRRDEDSSIPIQGTSEEMDIRRDGGEAGRDNQQSVEDQASQANPS